jgi:7-cyano-7-deazaguanine reductase
MAMNPLGHVTEYKTSYAPELLFPISRQLSRDVLGLTKELPFFGMDVWTGYELSWLNDSGKPIVATAEFFIPCNSEYIVESKSFKLYLNSFNQTKVKNIEELEKRLTQDLSAVVGTQVRVALYPISSEASALVSIGKPAGTCVDDLPVEITEYSPNPDLLTIDASNTIVEETLYSNLLKTNCPVTGQPDWATLVVEYRGPAINRESLLKFVVSYREHQDFHEHCVESIYMAIQARIQPEWLTVFARYTRRGGLDINPLRSSTIEFSAETVRLVRQ